MKKLYAVFAIAALLFSVAALADESPKCKAVEDQLANQAATAAMKDLADAASTAIKTLDSSIKDADISVASENLLPHSGTIVIRDSVKYQGKTLTIETDAQLEVGSPTGPFDNSGYDKLGEYQAPTKSWCVVKASVSASDANPITVKNVDTDHVVITSTTYDWNNQFEAIVPLN